jgi:hypothetical protein
MHGCERAQRHETNALFPLRNMQIRLSSIHGRFQAKINGIDNSSYEYGEKTSQSGIKRGFGDWGGHVKENWMG